MEHTEAPWLDVMRARLGTKEVRGKKHNPDIVQMFADVGHPEVKDDETAWCAAAVGSALVATSLPIPAVKTNLLARSYCVHGVACDPKPGAIAVWPRGNSAWQGHVNIVEDVRTYKGKTQVRCIGGNQNNAITLTDWTDVSKALAFRWPIKEEVKPPPMKPVIKTAVKSKSAWAQFMAFVTLIISYVTDWISVAWHWVSDIIASSPEIVGATGATVASAKQALSWVEVPWSKVGMGVVAASMLVVLVRHVQDKRRVPWD